MVLDSIIEIISLLLALTGLLTKTLNDEKKGPSWSNLSSGGKLVLFLLVVLSSIKIIKSDKDGQEQRELNAARDAKLLELKADNQNLLKNNQHLIKVMSVSSGYNASVSGVVVFQNNHTESHVRETLQNLFLKYAEVQIEASNSLGMFSGRIDHGASPEVRRFLNFRRVVEDSSLARLQNVIEAGQQSQAFFFEIRCANLKILNSDKIQYSKYDTNDQINVSVKVFDWWQDFKSLYNVSNLFIDKLAIEELDEVPIKKMF